MQNFESKPFFYNSLFWLWWFLLWFISMMLPGNLQSKSLSSHNITLEKRETEVGRSRWVTFLKTFSSPSVSHVLWNQAPCYPGAIFHEMELNRSPITSAGCLDNHIQKSQTWRSLQLHHGSQYTVDAVPNCSDTNRHLKSIIYSALVHLFIIYIYLHIMLIELSQSSILQNMNFFLAHVYYVLLTSEQSDL